MPDYFVTNMENGQPVLQANGSIANRLLHSGMDWRVLRPFVGEDNRSYINRPVLNHKTGELEEQPVLISNLATLRIREWELLDGAMLDVATAELMMWGDLRSRPSLVFNIPDAMGVTVVQSQNISNVNRASVSMDGIRRGPSDLPVYDTVGTPVPIIHKEFQLTLRELETGRRGGVGIDVSAARLSMKRCAEELEMMVTGATTFAYGGYSVYGYTNWPGRLTYSMTLPTAPGWTPATFITEITAIKKQLRDQYHRGPFLVYASTAWEPYLSEDYSGAKGDNTLLERTLRIRGIEDIKISEWLSGFTLIFVEMQPETVRALQGMDFRTLQWTEQGDMEFHFKIMGIMLPQLRGDQLGQTGVLHAVAA